MQNTKPTSSLRLHSSVSLAALTSGLIIAVSAALPQQAKAQEGAQASQGALQLPPLRVEGASSAQPSSAKQTAPLLDTPQTISVIPQKIIEEQGARNLTEVLRNTPGISFNAGENGFATSTNNFSLRGFDTSGSVFIDGVRDSGSYSRDVFNAEQVEVFKGPAADNGRGGAGGYVNIVTKTPGLQNFVRGGISLGFDDYGTQARKRATADVNQAVTDNIAFRLNAMIEDSGVAGRDVAEKNSWGLAPSLAFGLNTDFRAILSYEHVDNQDTPDWGVPGATLKGLMRYDATTDGAKRDKFYGLASDFDDVTVDTLTARFEYDISDNVTLSNQTRWSRIDRDARYTIPTGYAVGTLEATTQTQLYDRKNTALSNLTNLSARFDTGGIAHNLAVGLELMREKSNANRYGTANPGNTSIFTPDENRAFAIFPAPTEVNKVKVDTVAFYIYDTIKFNEQWQLTGGLRGEHYKAEINSVDAAGLPVGAFNGYDKSDFSLGGKIGLVFKPVEDGTVYAAFGTSTLPPGSFLSNPDISRPTDNAFPGLVAGAKDIRSYNYEVGTKWDFFNKRLTTSAALFYTEKHNVPITGRDPGDTTTTLKGYGKQIAKGLELSATGQVTQEWNVFGGIVFMDTERKHSAYLDDVRRRANASDYGAYLRTSGDRLAFTPNISGSLWTTYEFPIGLTLGGGLQYVGSSYLGRPDDALRIIPNGQAGKLPAYVVVNAMAAYALTENVDVRLNIDNLFNDTHAVSTNWNGSRATLGAPRTYLISTSFSF